MNPHWPLLSPIQIPDSNYSENCQDGLNWKAVCSGSLLLSGPNYVWSQTCLRCNIREEEVQAVRLHGSDCIIQTISLSLFSNTSLREWNQEEGAKGRTDTHPMPGIFLNNYTHSHWLGICCARYFHKFLPQPLKIPMKQIIWPIYSLKWRSKRETIAIC